MASLHTGRTRLLAYFSCLLPLHGGLQKERRTSTGAIGG